VIPTVKIKVKLRKCTPCVSKNVAEVVTVLIDAFGLSRSVKNLSRNSLAILYIILKLNNLKTFNLTFLYLFNFYKLFNYFLQQIFYNIWGKKGLRCLLASLLLN